MRDFALYLLLLLSAVCQGRDVHIWASQNIFSWNGTSGLDSVCNSEYPGGIALVCTRGHHIYSYFSESYRVVTRDATGTGWNTATSLALPGQVMQSLFGGITTQLGTYILTIGGLSTGSDLISTSCASNGSSIDAFACGGYYDGPSGFTSCGRAALDDDWLVCCSGNPCSAGYRIYCIEGALTHSPTRVPTNSTPMPSNAPTPAPSKAPTTATPSVTTNPTSRPSKAPTTAPTSSPSSAPTTGPTSSPSVSVIVPYDPNNVTRILGHSGINVTVNPDPGFGAGGNFIVSKLPADNTTVSFIARVVFVGQSGTEARVSGLLIPVVIEIPLLIFKQFTDLVTVCLGNAPEERVIIPECKYWDTQTNQWASDGCSRTNITTTAIECSCLHLTDFAAVLPIYNHVPAEEILYLTPENIGQHPTGVIAVFCVIGVFGVIFLVSYRRDHSEHTSDLRAIKQAKWGQREAAKIIGRVPTLWREIKIGLQLRHTWASLINRKSGTSFQSVDRAFVALVTVFASMCISARFHNLQQTWLGRGAVIAFSVLVCLIPAQVLTQLFVRTGPMGFYEEWQCQMGLRQPSSYKWLNTRLAPCWLWVWRACCLVSTIGMILYVLAISMLFDQNPKYYCAGNTASLWVSDWLGSYALAVLLVEPARICSFVAVARCLRSRLPQTNRRSEVSEHSQ